MQLMAAKALLSTKPTFLCSRIFFLLFTTNSDILENVGNLIQKEGSEI